MQCPSCKEINKDKVIDSRLSERGQAIRRRRAKVQPWPNHTHHFHVRIKPPAIRLPKTNTFQSDMCDVRNAPVSAY